MELQDVLPALQADLRFLAPEWVDGGGVGFEDVGFGAVGDVFELDYRLTMEGKPKVLRDIIRDKIKEGMIMYVTWSKCQLFKEAFES